MARWSLWLGRVVGGLCIVVSLFEIVALFSIESSRGLTPVSQRTIVAVIMIGFGAILLALNRAMILGGLSAVAGSALILAKPIIVPLRYESRTGETIPFGLTSETHLYFLVPAALLLLLAAIVLPLKLLPWSRAGEGPRRAVAAILSAVVSGLIGIFMAIVFFGGYGDLASFFTKLIPGVACVLAGVAQLFITIAQLMTRSDSIPTGYENGASTMAVAPTEAPSFSSDVESMQSLLEAIAYAPGSPVSEHGDDPLIGQQLDRFRLEKRLGAGGMGAVYRAIDERLKRPVAIKLIRPSMTRKPDLRERLLREARAAARINHQNVISIFDVCELEIGPCIVMELIEGESLRRRLESGQLSSTEARDVAIQIARALGAAHECGVIHRDLKPDNVIVAPKGVVKVLDFGIARFDHGASPETHPFVTSEGKILGTPAYMSPEQAEGGAIDLRTDIFSLGTLLFELLVGESPFMGKTMLATYDAVRNVAIRPELWTMVPRYLKPPLEGCLQREPGDRFSSAGELEQSLAESDPDR